MDTSVKEFSDGSAADDSPSEVGIVPSDLPHDGSNDVLYFRDKQAWVSVDYCYIGIPNQIVQQGIAMSYSSGFAGS
jgi:hypothetical protein